MRFANAKVSLANANSGAAAHASAAPSGGGLQSGPLAHAAELDGEPRVVEAEDGEPVPRQEAKRRLAEGDRGGLREPAEDAVVEKTVERSDDSAHPGGPVENSTHGS